MTATNATSGPTTAVDQVYAQSLLEMATETGSLDSVADEVSQLRQLLADQPDLMRLLGSQVLSDEERAASLKSLFEGKVSDLLYRFLLVVNDKGRLDRMPQVFQAFVCSPGVKTYRC